MTRVVLPQIKVFHQSINQSFYFCPTQHTEKINLTAVDKKKETMAKRYTLIHAHEKNLD